MFFKTKKNHMKKVFLTSAVVLLIVANVYSQTIPLIGSKAPSFTTETTNGKLTFPDDYGTNWKVLFSHPQDFTPVCTSELLELAYSQDDFKDLGVNIAVISTDDLKMHNLWKAHLEDLDYKGRGKQKIEFPILDDQNALISKKYGMLHETASSNRDIRGVFIIDSNNIVRSVNFYPMEIGRNIDELKRIIIALQTTEQNEVLTPANWVNGDDVLIPYFPYTSEQVSKNPEIKNDYYNVGERLWFKKMKNN